MKSARDLHFGKITSSEFQKGVLLVRHNNNLFVTNLNLDDIKILRILEINDMF